jgi:hypothetical protein
MPPELALRAASSASSRVVVALVAVPVLAVLLAAGVVGWLR